MAIFINFAYGFDFDFFSDQENSAYFFELAI